MLSRTFCSGRQARPYSSPVSESQVEDSSRAHGVGHIQGRGRSQRSRGSYVQRGEHAHRHRHYREEQWSHQSHQSHQQSTMGNDYDYSDTTQYFVPSHSSNAGVLDFGSFPTTYYNSQRQGQAVSQRRGKQGRGKQLDPRGKDLASSLKGLSLNEGESCHNQDSSRSGRMYEFSRQPKPSAALAEAIRKETKPSN